MMRHAETNVSHHGDKGHYAFVCGLLQGGLLRCVVSAGSSSPPSAFVRRRTSHLLLTSLSKGFEESL